MKISPIQPIDRFGSCLDGSLLARVNGLSALVVRYGCRYIDLGRDRDRAVEGSAMSVDLEQLICLSLIDPGDLETHRHSVERRGKGGRCADAFDLYGHP